jgi:hypothetical protein
MSVQYSMRRLWPSACLPCSLNAVVADLPGSLARPRIATTALSWLIDLVFETEPDAEAL